MRYTLSLLLVMTSYLLSAQDAPNFIITDSDGVEHDLYADHLDQGQTVVIKLFFTSCPPCISLAPLMESKYQQWGAGQYDVEFFELSTQGFDSNADVAQYKTTHNVSFPGAGSDGGSLDAVAPYQSGTFGPYFGTPTIIVLSPDGSVNMGVDPTQLDDAISATGATGMDSGSGGGGSTDLTTSYDVSASVAGISMPSSVNYFLKPANADTPIYDILSITGGSLDFEYPSDDFPELEEPVIIAVAEGSIIDGSVNPLDLLKIRKHILELETFDTEQQLLGADVNGDGNINALDLLNLQRALLDLISEFPNGTPSWKSIPSQIPLVENIGEEEAVQFTLIKTGNVN